MTFHWPSGVQALFAVALLSLAAVPARADSSVGVVVTGEATMQPQLVAQLETWLRTHGYDLVSTPLPPDAINELIDCFAIEDQRCARWITEKRAKTDAVVFAQVKLVSDASPNSRTATLTVNWLWKGKDVRTERRSCERCTNIAMRSAVDDLMAALAPTDSGVGVVVTGDSGVGVVVTGEAPMQRHVVAKLELWMVMHGYDPVSAPLPPEAINAVNDCFVVEDMACARKVVEKRAKADAILFVQVVNVAVGSSGADRTNALTAYWFDKGKDARSERRICERCTNAALDTTVDDLMAALAPAAMKTGQVELSSTPPGAKVLVGGQVVGKTPLDYRLPPGDHEIVFELEDRLTETRKVTVKRGKVAAVAVAFGPKLPPPSRTAAYVTLAGALVLGIMIAGWLVTVMIRQRRRVAVQPRFRDVVITELREAPLEPRGRLVDIDNEQSQITGVLDSSGQSLPSWNRRTAGTTESPHAGAPDAGATPMDTSTTHPSTPARPVPSYPDAATRALGEQLEDIRVRRQKLRDAGLATDQLDREILAVRRQLREGGQLRAGDELGDGRYLLVKTVGRGGFAVVWAAYDGTEQRHVAIKVLHANLAGDPHRRERFFRGAQAMRDLEHPAVVRVLEPKAEDGGFYYFVMELLSGGNLREAILANSLAKKNSLPLLLRVSEAVAKAHTKGMVHRDIKPANILLDGEGNPKLTDFDLVGAADTTGGTRTGALGTVIYAAPECLEKPQEATARADVYGLGMTALFCLLGHDLSLSAFRNPEPLIAKLACSSQLKQVLRQAVAWEPGDRFTDADALGRALREALDAPSGGKHEASDEGPDERAGASDGSTFDVFLSHNSHDRAAVRRLKNMLVEHKLAVWLDEDQLPPGQPWQPLLEIGIKSSRSVAVLIGEDGLGPWEDAEVQAALIFAVKDGRPVIPVLLPRAAAQPELPLFLKIRTWLDLREGFTDEGLAKLIWGITGHRPQTPVNVQ